MNSFKKAEAGDERLLIALTGPAGCGKTVSALRIATGIVEGTGKRIAFIDTENGRAKKYAKNFDFDHCDFQPPFRPTRYEELILEADKAGYSVIIVDSVSHEHEGPGGVLEWQEEELQKMAGNDYGKRERLKMTAWIKPKQARNRLIQYALQRSKAHIILCMRAKEKTDMKKVNGKMEVGKSGLQPIGGEEFAFEMSITMVLPAGSQGVPDWSEKCSRINDLDGDLSGYLKNCGQLTEETGRKIKQICSIKPTKPQKEFVIHLKSGDKEFDDAEQWRGEFLSVAGGLKKIEHIEKLEELHASYINKLDSGHAQHLNEALDLLKEQLQQPTEGIDI